jgi:hypothetical protein
MSYSNYSNSLFQGGESPNQVAGHAATGPGSNSGKVNKSRTFVIALTFISKYV